MSDKIVREVQDRPAGPASKTLGTLVEMNWDPITRIVGSLGIYTKVDFQNRTVAECRSTSSIFRGYSVFMKGRDPLDSHFITSRNGELLTTDLVAINLNIRIFLDGSFDDGWKNRETFVKRDPLGNEVHQDHSWNQTTVPRPQKRDLQGEYSWVMSPRWLEADGRPSGTRHRRRPDRPALGHGARGAR